jgi:hypothetical protein
MNKNSFIENERKSLEKMKKLQLPHSMKKIGFGIFVIFFITMFVNAFLINNIDLKLAAKYGVLIGLLITSISKEKIEDELVAKLRMQSYTFAFVMGVVYAIALPLIDYLFETVLGKESAAVKDMGDFTILWMLLFVQVFFFHYLKRMHK